MNMQDAYALLTAPFAFVLDYDEAVALVLAASTSNQRALVASLSYPDVHFAIISLARRHAYSEHLQEVL